MTKWEEGWPNDLDLFSKLGERLLGAIAQEAGGLKHWTSLSMCTHDMLEGKRQKIGLCLDFQQAIDDVPLGAGHMTMPAKKSIQAPDLKKEWQQQQVHGRLIRVCRAQPLSLLVMQQACMAVPD